MLAGGFRNAWRGSNGAAGKPSQKRGTKRVIKRLSSSVCDKENPIVKNNCDYANVCFDTASQHLEVRKIKVSYGWPGLLFKLLLLVYWHCLPVQVNLKPHFCCIQQVFSLS